MAERVLITGGAGFIGLRLAQTLVDRGATVTLLDNFFRGRHDGELRSLEERARMVEYDLTQPLPDDLPGAPFDQVYHLAAIVGVRYSQQMPHTVLRTNLLSTINVLDWCSRHMPEVVCLSSTSEVADGAARGALAAVPETVPFVIHDPLLPRASYALSKMACEQLLAHHARALGFRARIVRYHNVYGPRMGYAHVVPQFIERLLQRQDPFSIYGAAQTRAFCYVDDAVDATLRVTSLPTPEPLVVNVGDDREELSMLHLAHRLFSVAGFWPDLDLQPAPVGSPERRRPNIQRLRQLTGFEPRVSLDDGLQRTYAWYRQRAAVGAVGLAGN